MVCITVDSIIVFLGGLNNRGELFQDMQLSRRQCNRCHGNLMVVLIATLGGLNDP